jgi:polycystin 2
VKLIRYVDSRDYFVMACEFIYIIFVAYYIVEEVRLFSLLFTTIATI